MDLTQEQQEVVRGWAAEGASLSEIQSRLIEAFSIHLSYMDTRFLVIDLNAKIQDKQVPVEKKPEPVPDAEAFGDEEPVASEPLPPQGGVSVEISPIARPGFAVVGTVVFSDGTRAEWGVTVDGRLSLEPEVQGYRPTPEDLRAFQMKLRDLFASQGY